MRKRKVLVVEDQKLNRAVLKEILESEYDVLYAVNGKEALDIMNREGRHLSLVLLDIVMPVMDGYEVLKVMERRKLLEQIPVLVASQHLVMIRNYRHYCWVREIMCQSLIIRRY